MHRIVFAIGLLVLLAAAPARAQDLDLRAPTHRPHLRHAPLVPATRAMRVFVLRGDGPSGRAEALGRLDIESLGDADAAIELLQEHATRLDANAVIRVRILHEPEGRIRITGLAIRYI